MTIFTIDPQHSVNNTSLIAPAFHEFGPGARTLIVEAGAFLVANGDGALLESPGPWTVIVNGSVVSNTLFGIQLAPSMIGISKIIIGAEGQVGGLTGILAGSTVSIKNSGVISTGFFLDFAIVLSDGNDAVTNLGEIAGGVDLGSGNNTVTNSGQIFGGISGGSGKDIVINSGSVRSITLADGNNSFTNSGDVSLSAIAGAGNDIFINSGTVGDQGLVLGDGTNKLTNSGVIEGNAGGGSGNDRIVNSGTMLRDLVLGDGNNTLTNTGSIGSDFPGSGDVTGGAGNDTVNNNVHKVGKKSVAGVILGDVALATGHNVLHNAGKIEGLVSGDFMSVTNSGTLHDVALGVGSGTVNNKGTIEGFLAGTSVFQQTDGTVKVTMTNSGVIEGGVQLGTGLNSFVNSGKIIGLFEARTHFENGSNLTNLGLITGGYHGSEEVDVVTDFMKIGTKIVDGRIDGTIDLILGNDIFKGGKFAETVAGGAGEDTIKLAGGNDTYIGGNNSADGDDIVNGGKGIDLYDVSSATASLLINLDNVAHDLSPISGAGFTPANTVADFATPTFNDIATGFENAKGGSAGDLIYGSAAANVLEGGAGADNLLSYSGNDKLDGGSGADGLAGGAGKDILIGGTEGDAFQFFAIGDSGIGKASRDVITDFNDSEGDQIDLSKIDADTTNGAGDDAFTFIGVNVIFGHHAGELRAVSAAHGLIVEGDVNGDGKADFQIELSQPQIATFDGGDFIL